jgi:TrmH family RNA methyltransferase
MGTDEIITSASNPLVKRIRALRERKYRRREGAFVVAGVQPVWRAIEAGWPIETLVVVPSRLPESAHAMIAEQRGLGARVAALAGGLADRLTDRDQAPGLLAVVGVRTTALADLTVPPDGVYVALHEIGNPGNLGTVIRTADAAGAAGLILVGAGADPYAPTAVKASMGSLFALPVVAVPTAGGFLDWARGHEVRVLATSGRAEPTHWSVDYRPPLALLLGSEGEGLPMELLGAAEQVIRIPMVGTAESLNLAVAAGLVLYQARRRALNR